MGEMMKYSLYKNEIESFISKLRILTIALLFSLATIAPTLTFRVNAASLDVSGCSFTKIGTTWSLDNDCDSTAQIDVPAGYTLEGNSHTISATFEKDGNSNNSILQVSGDGTTIQDVTVDGSEGTDLHGINIYVAENVNLDNVTSLNNRSGVVVNGSNVTVNNITTGGNIWHGINVDLGDGVTSPAALTVNGTSSHIDDALHIFSDDVVDQSITFDDTNSQYSTTKVGDARIWTLTPTRVEGLQIRKGHATDSPILGCEAYTNSTQIRIEWDANDADNIDYYWFGTKNNSKHAKVTGGDTFYNGNMTPGNNPYYYTVIAVDVFGNESPISEQCGVTLDTAAPSTPEITSPNNEQYFTSTPILNEWSISEDENDIEKYQVEYVYDDEHTFSNAPYREIPGNQTSRNHTPNTNEQGGVTIRVRAFDVAGNVSDWSESVHYYYDATAPSVPTPENPQGDTSPYYTGDGFTQSWSDESASGAVSYEYLSCYQSMEPVGNECPSSSTTWPSSYTGTSKTVGANQPDSHFFWHVRSVDVAGNVSDWSEWREIVIDSSVPSDITNVTIEQLSTGFDVTNDFIGSDEAGDREVRIEWEGGEDDNFKEFEYETSTGFTTTVVNKFRVGTIAPAGVAHGDTYEYRVRAIDQAENTGEWSDWVSVTFDLENPTFDITPATANVETGDEVTLTVVNLTGDLSGINDYSWVVTGASIIEDNDDTITIASAVEGAANITLTITDNAGNSSTETATVSFSDPVVATTQGDDNDEDDGDEEIPQLAVGGGTGDEEVFFAQVNNQVDGNDNDQGENQNDDESEENNGNTAGTNTDESADGEVQGVTDEAGNEASLSWVWWLLIIAAIAALYLLFAKRRAEQE